jgi:predicted transcriptional regulator
MASSLGAGRREPTDDGRKRQNQRPVTTYLERELFDAMHEVAWRRRLTFAAALTEAMEDFVKKPIKAPEAKPEKACANRREKKTVTAYLDPPLAEQLHDVAWRRRMAVSAAASRAIRNYVKKHSKTPAPA